MEIISIIELVVVILLIILLSVVFARLLKVQKQRDEIRDSYKDLEMKVLGLELESVKYKLNPHLFKNILNSIQSHAYQTYHALDKLSTVLDYILYESDKGLVSVKSELNFALSLIEINKLKLSPLFDLRIKNKIDEDNPLYEQTLIAPLISVDLIENAFKHADLQSPEAFISIVFELKNNSFFLTVSNKISDKPKITKERSGFGQENFLKRLDHIYNENYSLEQFIEDNTYISQLKIKLVES